ncbi:MAG TPA: carboxypeptidase regulatory-like domain-containing protein [Verrucomicrobiae bacterium]|nr:carboxypeptidase regulatory-like domain-containing protein [Verrucomicrobiae bacterium]
MARRSLAVRLAVFSLLTLLASPALGQSTGGRILGRVADPSGAVLANVSVRITNQATGVARETKTNGSGDYTFVEVAPGNYTAEFEQKGFKRNVQKDLTVEINQVVTLNSTLQIGATAETVVVTSEAPLVDTTSTQLGAVVGQREVANLPLNERDTYALLQLQPGVQSQLGSDLFYGSDKPGVVSVNGGRGRANNYSVNGGDGNDQFANLPVVQPSPDSIQEFRVITNTFDAEYGRNSGAVVNVVTKGGTNQFHGDVYEYFRNKTLNARGYFDTIKPDLKQNQFGATFGGPIKKDRSFFFASYEGRRIIQGISSDTVTVPTDAERLGDFSAGTPFPGSVTTQTLADVLNSRNWTGTPCSTAITSLGGTPPPTTLPSDGVTWASIFPTNVIPRDCQDPVSLSLLQQYVPHANRSDGTFQAVPNGNNYANQFTLRLDHRINDRQQFNAYYYFTDHNQLDPFAKFESGGANLPGFGALTDERFQQWNFTHTWTLNPTTVNEARFTYFREGQLSFLHPQHTFAVTDSCSQSPNLLDPTLLAAAKAACFTGQTDSGAYTPFPGSNFGVTPGLGPGREGVPFINISGEFNIGNNLEGEIPQVGNTFQWTDNLTKTIGNHTAKFGIDVRRQRFDQTLYFNVNGWDLLFGATANDFGFDDLIPNYLIGTNDQYVQGAAQREAVRSTSVYLFGQDSWKIKPNITLNYGLRWELNTPLTDVGHKVQTFRPGQADTVYPCRISAGALGLYPVGTDCGPNGPGNAIFPTGLVVPGDKGIPAGLTSTYYKAFAPRIGIAWDPTKNGTTSIRAGFGIFYNPIEQLVLEQFSAEPPFGGSPLINTTFIQTPFYSQYGFQFPNPFNGILQTKPGDTVDWSIFRPILLYGEFQPHLRSQYAEQYNLSIQRQLTKDLVLQVGYVGSQNHRLLATHDLNYGNAQTCNDLQTISDLTGDSSLACGPFYADSPFGISANEIPAGVTLHLPYGPVASVTGPNPQPIGLVGLRKYSSPQCNPIGGWDPANQVWTNGCPSDGNPVFSSIFAQDTIANAAYNSLQASLEKRMSHGLQFQVAYTWSKSFDQASSFEAILNPLDPRRSRSLSQFDARHRFVLSYVWDLPTPKYSGFTGKIANGWDLSGIVTVQSGFPIRITSQDDIEEMNSFDFELPGQPNQTGPLKTQDPRKNGGYWFDPALFTNDTVPLGTFGNAKRTICCGPGIGGWDFALHKNTPVTERQSIEFRAEFFNFLNHTQFLQPDGNITDGSDFGRIKRARAPRQLQFALKWHF